MNLLLLILGNYEQHYFIYHCEDFLQFDPMFTYTCNPGRILKMFLKDDPHNYFIEKGVEGYIYRKEKWKGVWGFGNDPGMDRGEKTACKISLIKRNS